MGDASRWLAAPDPWDDDLGPEGAAFSARSEPVRTAMRAVADEVSPEIAGTLGLRLAAAIDAAPDLAMLWALRMPLADALVLARGEPASRECMAELDTLFLEAWPDAPVMRA